MASAATIHVAHSIHRKGGLTTFRAVAVVTNQGCVGYHTHRLAVDDTAEEAETRAIDYVRETFRTERLDPPAATIRHGRRPAVDIDTVSFVHLPQPASLPAAA